MSRVGTWNLLFLAIAVGVATFLFVRHCALTELRKQNAFLHGKVEQLRELHAQNKLLSMQTQVTAVASLSPEEFRELLRLRGEAGLLRNQLAEAMQTKQAGLRMDDVARDRTNAWSNVGAATPEAAIETFLWALQTTNFNQATGALHFELNGLAPGPGAKARPQNDFMEHIREEWMPRYFTNLESLEIISIEPRENDQLELTLWETTRDGNRRRVSAEARRVGNEWKFLAEVTVLELDRSGDVERTLYRVPFFRKEQREAFLRKVLKPPP